jgi:DNA-directed RNA polymerase subunit M/transcription elongation factor TFIIS
MSMKQGNTEARCVECGKLLVVSRTCLRTKLICVSCRKEYSVSQFADSLQESLEEELGRIPADRI